LRKQETTKDNKREDKPWQKSFHAFHFIFSFDEITFCQKLSPSTGRDVLVFLSHPSLLKIEVKVKARLHFFRRPRSHGTQIGIVAGIIES
jgi:hypothetical protein